jgi:hypothetical protein
MSQNGTGRYYGTYRYVLVVHWQENVKRNVRVRTQLRTERYRAVQKGTGQYTVLPCTFQVFGEMVHVTRQSRYRSKYNKVQGSTWRYMSVHGLHLRRAAGGGAGGGRPILVRFSNRCIDCTNSGFSFKSLHAQTRLFIPWGPCPRLPCQCYGPPLCHPRAAAAAAAATGDAVAGASPAAAAAAGGGITSRSPAPPAPSVGGGAARGTSLSVVKSHFNRSSGSETRGISTL